MVPLKGAASAGQTRLLHAAVVAVLAKEVAEAPALVFGLNDLEIQRSGSSEVAVFVPYPEHQVCLSVAGAGAKIHRAPAAVTSIEVLDVCRGLERKGQTRRSGI